MRSAGPRSRHRPRKRRGPGDNGHLDVGVDAPLDDIARRAGTGNATLYRHFPTRRELIIAVYADEVTALSAHGEALRNRAAPGEAFFDWLRAFIAHVATKRHLALAIAHDREGQRSALFDRWHQAMHSTASALLTLAQRAGALRADLEATDLLALANGIALTGADADQIDRLLRILSSRSARLAPGLRRRLVAPTACLLAS